MSSAAKKKLSDIICLAGTLLMVFAIARMIPPGLAGNFAQARTYFFFMLIGLFMGVAGAFASTYHRSKAEQDESGRLESIRAQVAILAKVAQKSTKTRK